MALGCLIYNKSRDAIERKNEAKTQLIDLKLHPIPELKPTEAASRAPMDLRGQAVNNSQGNQPKQQFVGFGNYQQAQYAEYQQPAQQYAGSSVGGRGNFAQEPPRNYQQIDENYAYQDQQYGDQQYVEENYIKYEQDQQYYDQNVTPDHPPPRNQQY